ncbi:MAG: AMP-binding protein [Burkholderiales bacterium]
MVQVRTPAPSVEVTRRDDGSILLRSGIPLAPVRPSLPHLFDDAATAHPDRVFMRQRMAPGGAWREITYGQAARDSRAVAQWLLNQGAKPGDAVAVLSGNSLEHAVLSIGAQRVRVAVAPMSAGYSLMSTDHAKLKGCVARSGARFAFVDNVAPYAKALAALAPMGLRVIAVAGQAEGIETVPYAELVATEPTAAVEREMAAITHDTVARIMFTSGSTGTPKATPQTQANLTITVAQARSLGILDFGGEAPQHIEAMPFSHIMAGNFNLNNVIGAGGTIHLDDGKPIPALFAQTIANLREVSPHFYITVPLGYTMLCDAMEKDDALRDSFFKNLVYMGFGGAMLSDALVERLDALALKARGEKVPMYTFYGATEYLFGALRYWVTPRMDIIGLPLPDTDLKLVPDGAHYELRVKGRTLLPRSGYLGDAQASEALFDEEGFFRTGDAVRFADPANPIEGIVFSSRVAEDFKLTSGTYVAVNALRLDLMAAGDPLLREAVICGLNRDGVGALLWLNDVGVRAVLGEAVAALTNEQLASDERVVALLRDRIASFNAANPSGARAIRRAVLMAAPLTYDSGELTDKGTASQRVVRERRSADVEQLFAQPAGPAVLTF